MAKYHLKYLQKGVILIKGRFLAASLCMFYMLILPVLPVKAQTSLEEVISCSCTQQLVPELALQSRGPAVKTLQEQLMLLGINPGSIDGVFGSGTAKAVEMFQTLRGLEPTGRVDTAMWQELYRALGESGLEDVDPESRVTILIDRATRKLTVRVGGRFYKQYPVAVGTYGTPSPLGDWRIIHKALSWGSGFGTRWMGLNVPWGIYGVHGTNNPGSIGSYASHGCIRMFNKCVEELYPLVERGTLVRIIDSGQPVPFPSAAKKLRPGSSGQHVIFLQWRLQALGIPVSADGRLGPASAWAIRYFQATHGLPSTGEIDDATLEALKAHEPDDSKFFVSGIKAP